MYLIIFGSKTWYYERFAQLFIKDNKTKPLTRSVAQCPDTIAVALELFGSDGSVAKFQPFIGHIVSVLFHFYSTSPVASVLSQRE